MSTSALKPWDTRRSNGVFKLAKKDSELALLLVEEEAWQGVLASGPKAGRGEAVPSTRGEA